MTAVVTVRGPSWRASICSPEHDHITAALQAGRYYESDLLDAVRELRIQGTFVDVGAHVGNHTVYFALECDATRVIAIEPDRENFDCLTETVALNRLDGRVECFRVAVHQEWRSAHVLPGSGGNSGMARIGEGGDIPVARLDEILRSEDQVGFVKIDVEGLSASVLETMRETISRDMPVLAVEAIDDTERARVEDILLPLGYRPRGPYCSTPVWVWVPGNRDTVTVGISSIPSREHLLEQAVASLIGQADRVGVYLNGFPSVPAFLDDPRIEVARSQEHGDRGDAGKFFWSDATGYNLTCDDDLMYPNDYVARLIDGIERYERTAIVSFHGAIFPLNPRDSQARRSFPCLDAVWGDYPVHVLGTGVLGWHSDTWSIPLSIFGCPNMADIWLAAYAQQLKIPFIVLGHWSNWLKDLDPQDTISIHSEARSGSPLDTRDAQTVVVRETEWALAGAL